MEMRTTPLPHRNLARPEKLNEQPKKLGRTRARRSSRASSMRRSLATLENQFVV